MTSDKITIEDWEEYERLKRSEYEKLAPDFGMEFGESTDCPFTCEKNNARMLYYRSRALSKKSFVGTNIFKRKIHKIQIK